MKKDIKEELISVMSPIFGEEVKKLIEEHYDSKNPEELIDLASHMLTGYMGEQNASKLLSHIVQGIKK